jgi:hypothetical protein
MLLQLTLCLLFGQCDLVASSSLITLFAVRGLIPKDSLTLRCRRDSSESMGRGGGASLGFSKWLRYAPTPAILLAYILQGDQF